MNMKKAFFIGILTFSVLVINNSNCAAAAQINLFIRASNHAVYQVSCTETDTIEGVKTKIFAQYGLSAQTQHFLLRDKELDNADTIQEISNQELLGLLRLQIDSKPELEAQAPCVSQVANPPAVETVWAPKIVNPASSSKYQWSNFTAKYKVGDFVVGLAQNNRGKLDRLFMGTVSSLPLLYSCTYCVTHAGIHSVYIEEPNMLHAFMSNPDDQHAIKLELEGITGKQLDKIEVITEVEIALEQEIEQRLLDLVAADQKQLIVEKQSRTGWFGSIEETEAQTEAQKAQHEERRKEIDAVQSQLIKVQTLGHILMTMGGATRRAEILDGQLFALQEQLKDEKKARQGIVFGEWAGSAEAVEKRIACEALLVQRQAQLAQARSLIVPAAS